MKIGIDFGTSYSIPAVVYRGKTQILQAPGSYGVPSVFYYSKSIGRPLAGKAAEAQGKGVHAGNLVREIKMHLTSSDSNEPLLENAVTLDGRRFLASDIVAEILNEVMKVASSSAVFRSIGEDVEGVVISVPAQFTDREREIILKGARKPKSEGGPGLTVLGLIKEPVAAALSYYDRASDDSGEVMVYDLGGGTCDTAIVSAREKAGSRFVVKGTDTLRLGGKNWDDKLVDYLYQRLTDDLGREIIRTPDMDAKIRTEAIVAKHQLTIDDQAFVSVEIGGREHMLTVARSEFERTTAELLNRTMDLAGGLLGRDDNSATVRCERIVCVGGGSNMPQVLDGITRRFPGMEVTIDDPEHAVVRGAAIYAQECDGELGGRAFLQDIAPFSYGIRSRKSLAADAEEHIINLIKKGDDLPCEVRSTFRTRKDNQKSACLRVYESEVRGESCEIYQVGDSDLLELTLPLSGTMPRGSKVAVSMTLTVDGVLKVAADDGAGNHVERDRQVSADCSAKRL